MENYKNSFHRLWGHYGRVCFMMMLWQVLVVLMEKEAKLVIRAGLGRRKRPVSIRLGFKVFHS